MLDELMLTINNLENEGKEEHDGSKIDLARVLRAVIKTYETKGIEHLIRSLNVRRLIERAEI